MLGLITNALHGLLLRERGQTLAEYGVLISVLAVFIVVVAVLGFSDAVTNVFSDMVSCLSGSCGP